MRQLNGDGKQDFKVKSTPLKHTDGKGSFLQVDKGRLFFKKIVLRGIQNTRNFHHGRSERLACFETPSGSKVFEEFSGTFCTLQCIVKKMRYLWIIYLRRLKNFEIDLSALFWDLCWIIFVMCSDSRFYLHERIHEPNLCHANCF